MTAIVVARFRDGRTLQWSGGAVTGDHMLRGWLDRPLQPTAAVLPEGPEIPTTDYEQDPWSFVAACLVVDPREQPELAMDGMPDLPGATVPAGAIP